MALISERINAWVEDRITAWKERLRGWAISVISLGVEAFVDIMGKKVAQQLKPAIDKIEATGAVTPEIQPILDELRAPSGEAALAFGHQLSGALVSGAIGSLIDWLLRPFITALSKVPGFYLPRSDILLTCYYRGLFGTPGTDEARNRLKQEMSGWGISAQGVDILLHSSKPLFPSEVVGPLALRDPEK